MKYIEICIMWLMSEEMKILEVLFVSNEVILCENRMVNDSTFIYSNMWMSKDMKIVLHGIIAFHKLVWYRFCNIAWYIKFWASWLKW
jgi:hypothetical protein